MEVKSVLRGTARGLDLAGGFLTRRRRARAVYWTAFLLPFFVIGLLWAFHGVRPFGSRMILAHDQWHQYYPFFLDLRRRLADGSSLLHSWTTGMGLAYLPMYAYYLASPLNLPAVLLPESLVMPYYAFTVLLRLGLASLFFALMLRKLYGRSDLMLSLFSSSFALCAFLMGYYWNAIWLDTVALLPLVMLGLISLLRNGRFVLYTAALALSIWCSYYIALFVCIFVVLVFIGWHIANWDDLGGFGVRLAKLAFFSILAAGLTAVLSLPTYLGMGATSSAVNKWPEALAFNMGEKATWEGALNGAVKIFSQTGTMISPTTMEGLPNLFCGFSTVILAVLFLFCGKISLRERLCALFLLLFFAASFLIRQLDYLWHGMHFPNMLPYRFSFLWSFVVIWMAYRLWLHLPRLRWWHLLLALVPTVGLVWCVFAQQDGGAAAATVLVAVLTLTLLALYVFRVAKKTHFAVGLCAILLFELISGAALGVNKVSTTDEKSYPSEKEAVSRLIDQMNAREADTIDLWRADMAIKQSLNDPTLVGMRGVSVFSSAANSRVSEFLQSIGLAASVAGNRYAYQEADPFTNLLLNVKYLIDRTGRYTDPTWFTKVGQEGKVLLLENQAYLPLGFLVREAVLNYDQKDTSGSPYDRLNRLFREMTGEEEALFQTLRMTSLEKLGDAETTYQTGTAFGATSKISDEENCIEVRYTLTEGGHLCIYSKSQNCSDVVVFVNGERAYTYSDKYGYNRYFGRFEPGTTVSLRYRPKTDKTGYVTVYAATFSLPVFERGYEKLSKTPMITTRLSDTVVEGAIRVEEAGVLYTSIPYDEGWKLTVDGEKHKITPVGGAMIACRLTPGLHSILLEYEAPGFALGLKISLGSALVFAVLLVLALLGRLGRPPIVRLPMTLADPDAPVALPPAPEPEPPAAPEEEPADPDADIKVWKSLKPTVRLPDLPAEEPAGEAAAPAEDAPQTPAEDPHPIEEPEENHERIDGSRDQDGV